MANKMETLPAQMIVLLYVNFYGEEVIMSSKQTLHDSRPDEAKWVNCMYMHIYGRSFFITHSIFVIQICTIQTKKFLQKGNLELGIFQNDGYTIKKICIYLYCWKP